MALDELNLIMVARPWRQSSTSGAGAMPASCPELPAAGGEKVMNRRFVQKIAQSPATLHAIKRHRKIVGEALGRPDLEFLQHRHGDARHIELQAFFDRQPDQFHKFSVGADGAVDARRDGIGVDGKETGVETTWPPRRRDGAGDEVHRGEIGCNARSGEFHPFVLAGALPTPPGREAIGWFQDKACLLEHFANGGERKPRDFCARVAYLFISRASTRLSSGVAALTRRSASSTRPPANTYFPGMNLWP